MPLFSVKTNVAKDKVSDEFLKEASNLVAQMIGKPEMYVSVFVEAGLPMTFSGSTDPCAYCEVQSIGKIGGKLNNQYAKSLYPLIKKHLGIDGERMYIKFTDVDAAAFAHNGKCFA